MSKSFTLIELMVVMGIIAALLALGTLGLTNFRNTAELRNAYSDIVSIIQETQNKARNSVSIGSTGSDGLPIVPDYYVIDIQANNYTLQSCNTTGGTNLVCNNLAGRTKPSQFSLISYTGTCDKIGFKRSSSDVVALNSSNAVINSGICTIEVRHSVISNILVIRVNMQDNTISFED